MCCTVVSPLGPPCQDGVFYLFGGTDGAARQSDVHACAISKSASGMVARELAEMPCCQQERGRCDLSSDKRPSDE